MPKERLLLRNIITLEKGKPPAEQPYFGHDAELYLTPEYLRGRAVAETVKPSRNAVRIKDGDTIVLWDGSNAGEIFRGRKGILSSTMSRLGHDERFDVAYFFYALKSYEWFLKGQTTGSGIPHVDKGIIGNISIYQFNNPEQTKIAEILSTVDRAIEQTEALIAKQQRIKTGLMNDLLTRGIDEQGNFRSEETHQFKDSPLGRIPVEWGVKTLSEVAKVDRGKFTHRPRNDPRFYGGKYPFIQTGDITSNVGRTVSSFTQSLNENGAKVSKEFPAGTIAITIAANIADTAILGIPMFFPDSVVGAVINRPNNIRYVELVIRKWKPLLEAWAPQSAQKNINLEVLRPLPIPCPEPEEQEKIGNVYNEFDFNQERMEKSLLKLLSLKTALMQDLLTGRRRVTTLLNETEVMSQ